MHNPKAGVQAAEVLKNVTIGPFLELENLFLICYGSFSVLLSLATELGNCGSSATEEPLTNLWPLLSGVGVLCVQVGTLGGMHMPGQPARPSQSVPSSL